MVKEKTEKKKVTKDMTFAELINQDPEKKTVLAENGLGCGGCFMSQMETIEDGALAHGIDPEELLEELNS